MALSEEFTEYVLEQLRRVAAVQGKRMFGGMGLYLDGLFFAILQNDTLYLKVDDRNRGDYERSGMKPFQPYADRPMTFQYYELPAAVLEDEDELRVWLHRALQAVTPQPQKTGSPASRRYRQRKNRGRNRSE